MPPGSRADVVVSIPATATGVLTLWTQDYQRTGAGYANIPTVPVMHLNVTGTAGTPYTLAAGTALRPTGDLVEVLGAATASLLDPTAFVPPKLGRSQQNIQLSTMGGMTGIDGVMGSHDVVGPYTGAAHMGSSRWAKPGDLLQLTVQNTTAAHHPFHLHGFSIQPISLTHATLPAFTFPYAEYRDNVDIPAGYTLTFRVRLDPRALVDGVTPGGALGRWMFHCHIFFHAHLGMISELVVGAADGSVRPYVDVGGSWAYASAGGIAERDGTYAHPDGDPVSLTASLGTVVDNGAGSWSWTFDTTGIPDQITYVYITATDAAGRRDQTIFRLKIGAPDDGADNGDPHIHTVDGRNYDFQAVGEFVLLRDREGMEVQARQSPVLAATPITDPYSGLTACVSVNTAVAARVGTHRIAYQPDPKGRDLRLFIDGKPAKIPREGLDLGSHRLSMYEVEGGGTVVRVDYAHHAVLTITPYFWAAYDIWLLNVAVSRTDADEGLMGPISASSWLPDLPNGSNVGPMPEHLDERYVALYRTFADAWRVTDATSLFVYARGTSTETFTDRKWPAEKLPCTLAPQFEVPEHTPVLQGMSLEKARQVCRLVTLDDLHRDCVFDVATTGDEAFAHGYRLAQALALRGTAVQLHASKSRSRSGEAIAVTAIVSVLRGKCTRWSGDVTFLVDDVSVGSSIALDERGRVTLVVSGLKTGKHRIRATYSGGNGEDAPYPSSSPNLLHAVEDCDDHHRNDREDLDMEHKFDVPTGHGEKTTEVNIDVKTARRILAFVNNANRPEDLMRAPEVLTHLHVEYRNRGFPERHPTAHELRHHHHEIAEKKLAIDILKHRNESPVYGFHRFADLLQIDRIREIIRKWWFYFSRASKGEWTGPFDIPTGSFDRPVHAAVLRTGKVLFFGLPTGKDSWLWTPSGATAGTVAATANKPGDSLFCAGHVFLSDGRLLVVGGGGDGTGPRHNHGWIFDPTPGVETWTRTAGNGTPGNGDMNFYRWYPTLIMMGDEPGRVLVVSGDDTSYSDVRQMEMYMESSDRFELVWGPGGVGDTSANHSFPQLYPSMHLLPGGEVFYTPTGWHSGGCSGAADYDAAKPSGFYEFSST